MTAFTSPIGRRRSAVVLRALAAAGFTLSLAGCYTEQVAQNTYPTDYRERHPITLKEGVQTVEIFLSRNRGGLNPSQRADVLAFAQGWRRDATSGIIVDVPQGGPTDRAAADSMREVNSILAASGVPRGAVYVRSFRPSGAALASIKINYSKLTAEAGPCGHWPNDLGPGSGAVYTSNQPYWNFGCASQRNLAAMVDNPADLVQPRGETPAYAGRRSIALDKYRKGDNPSATYANDTNAGYTTGKISDLGK
jgi:pilus assembly protein CpaD